MQTDVMQKLQEPFKPEDIEWRIGATNGEKTKGLALAYVTNRAIMNRLDEVFSPFGWQNEYREWKKDGMKGSQLCGISVKCGDEWITKWDGADDSDTEAIKGGLSDAMKRAGYQWGIGRYLYNLDSVWVAIKPIGKSYALAGDPPKLPAWALPGGYQPATGTKGNTSTPTDGSAVASNKVTATQPPTETKSQQQDSSPSQTPGSSQNTFSPEDLLELKKAFQDFKGSLDGFEGYIDKQKVKGWDATKIIAILKSATKK